MTAAAFLLSISGTAAAQTGGVTFKFFSSSNGSKPDLISRSVDYAPGTTVISSIKAWSGQTASQGFSASSNEPNDLFGFSASSAGDVDGDGLDDIVVGAPLSNAGGSACGRLDIFSAETGLLIRSISGSANQILGTAVAGVGDVDGDGASDIAATGKLDQNGTQHDAVYLYSGATGAIIRAYTTSTDDGFGYMVRGLGDLNGDGSPELAIVASHRATAGSSFTHAEVDIVNTAATGDERIRLVLAEDDKCIIDVNVVIVSGITFIDAVTMAVDGVYNHVLFDLSGVKITTASDNGDYRFQDVNKDNKIDQEDVWLLLEKINTDVDEGSPFKLDVNKDGVIDANDLTDVVSASTNAPILKELSFFAQNRLLEMSEHYPLYFGLTADADMTAPEKKVDEKKDDCKECPKGQKKVCDKCCGPGEWVEIDRENPTIQYYPSGNEGMNQCWRWGARANKSMAEAWVDAGRGDPGAWPLNAWARYQWHRDVKWQGSGPACPRKINLRAVGGFSHEVNASVGAAAGSSAFANANGSGTCSSLDPASADFTAPDLKVTCSCTSVNAQGSASLTYAVVGNAGEAVQFGATVAGTYSAQTTVSGQLNGGGSGEYNVISSRHYEEECSIREYDKFQKGKASVQGSLTAYGFACTYHARSHCDIAVN